MVPPADPKRALRALLRARRVAHPGTHGARLIAHLEAHPRWRTAGSVAGYMAVRGELPVLDALLAARARGAAIALPLVSAGTLSFHRWSGEPLTTSAFGIPEPDPALSRVDPTMLDVILVPGVAFTRAGARLGQGGGYYDRVLAGPRGFTIGVAWSFQVVDAVPTDPWDQPVDALVTEAGWVLGG